MSANGTLCRARFAGDRPARVEVRTVAIEPVGIGWEGAAKLIGLWDDRKTRKRNSENFCRWRHRRGIEPDECGLFSVQKLKSEFAVE